MPDIQIWLMNWEWPIILPEAQENLPVIKNWQKNGWVL